MTEPSDDQTDFLVHSPLDSDVARSVFDHVSLGLLLTDNADRCVETNQTALEIFGVSRVELIGRVLREFWTQGTLTSDDGRRASPSQETAGTRTWGLRQLSLRNQDLQRVELTTFSHLRPGLHLTLISEVSREHDLSEATEAQWLSAQRTDTLGRLAGGIAHDFNNLLTAINGHVQLAAQLLSETNEAQEHLSVALQAGLNARDVVQRILLFARSTPEGRRVFELSDLVRETSGLISASLPSSLSLELDLPDGATSVEADQGVLQHVLMNLCTRAARALEGRSGTLTIRVLIERGGRTSGEPASERVVLAVSDTGRVMVTADLSGIADARAPRHSAEGVDGRDESIVWQVVAGQGGDFRVRSSENRGNCYEIHLPIHRATPVEKTPESTPAARGTKSIAARILVIDDEPSVSHYLKRALQRRGHLPEAYTSATEGWARFVDSPSDFQLLIVDLAMPGMAGLEIVQRARELCPGLPVLLMSGDLQQCDLSAIAGQTGVVQMKKPIEVQELWNLVDRCLCRV